MDELEPTWFEGAERFVEAAIGASLVALWLLALALHLAGPYVGRVAKRMKVRLAADVLATSFGLLRGAALVSVFLASFIYFYPDVLLSNDLPVTGGLAACLALAAMLARLVDSSPGARRSFGPQSILLGLGALLYVVPYVLGTQLTDITGSLGPVGRQLTAGLVSSQNQALAVGLSAASQEIALLLGAVAVVYVLRMPVAAGQRTRPETAASEVQA